jgi:cobalamin biosynthesis protein CobT
MKHLKTFEHFTFEGSVELENSISEKKKLPEALQKAIDAKKDKADKKDDDKEEKDTDKSKKSKKDDKDDKDEKTETKGLTAAQKKLPAGLQKAIAAKKKK